MKKSMKKEVFSWMISVVVALTVAFLCRTFLFSPSTVHGESMSPTFQDTDRIIISKISKIQRFDLVVFQAPDANERYIKRIIGLPGDRVEMKNDVLYINGKVIEEPYLEINKDNTIFNHYTGDFTLAELTGEEKVPQGKLFVLGDNRLVSKDSRYFGFISEESVIGEVKFRIYPIKSMGVTK
ncbi:MAG TPA: signal peptidase I [Niallia sp.]|nr:signal peptidase I [Niallia sp.]